MRPRLHSTSSYVPKHVAAPQQARARTGSRAARVTALAAATLAAGSAFAAPAMAHETGSSAGSSAAKSYAASQMSGHGWSERQFSSCLEPLWEKESGWQVDADNPSSSAYGIPQALPGSKMASEGGDWRSNAETQVDWGLGYIEDRYGSPCEAWEQSQDSNWY